MKARLLTIHVGLATVTAHVEFDGAPPSAGEVIAAMKAWVVNAETSPSIAALSVEPVPLPDERELEGAEAEDAIGQAFARLRARETQQPAQFGRSLVRERAKEGQKNGSR